MRSRAPSMARLFGRFLLRAVAGGLQGAALLAAEPLIPPALRTFVFDK